MRRCPWKLLERGLFLGPLPHALPLHSLPVTPGLSGPCASRNVTATASLHHLSCALGHLSGSPLMSQLHHSNAQQPHPHPTVWGFGARKLRELAASQPERLHWYARAVHDGAEKTHTRKEAGSRWMEVCCCHGNAWLGSRPLDEAAFSTAKGICHCVKLEESHGVSRPPPSPDGRGPLSLGPHHPCTRTKDRPTHNPGGSRMCQLLDSWGRRSPKTPFRAHSGLGRGGWASSRRLPRDVHPPCKACLEVSARFQRCQEFKGSTVSRLPRGAGKGAFLVLAVKYT